MKTYSSTPKKNEVLIEIACPLCGHGSYKKYWNLDDYSFSKCPKCSLVYQNPQPVASFVEDRYDNDYFSYEIDNEDSFLELMLLGLKDIGFDPKYVDGDNKHILDIGCATGLFLSYMKGLGWETSGVEVCKEAAAYGNKNRDVNIFSGILDDAPFLDSSFDVIHLSHVIEHINNPKDFLEKINRLLKPGGVFYCITPNINGLQAKYFKSKWRSAIADHMILFSVKTLNNILRETGFSKLKYKTWGGMCAGSGFPLFVKNILDRACKPLNFGDVMIFRAVKK